MRTLKENELRLIGDKDTSVIEVLKQRSADEDQKARLLYRAFLIATANGAAQFANEITSHIVFENLDNVDIPQLLPREDLGPDCVYNPYIYDNVSSDISSGRTCPGSPAFTIVHESNTIHFPGVDEANLDRLLGLNNLFAEFEDPQILLDSIENPILKKLVSLLTRDYEDWYMATPIGMQVYTQTISLRDEISKCCQVVGFHPTPEDYAFEINTFTSYLIEVVRNSRMIR